MKKIMESLRFSFKNGETWTVDRQLIGDLWIKQVSTSFGRINGGDFEEIHPCESLRIEVYPEADHVMSEDINLGGLELGMFERVTKYSDIYYVDIMYREDSSGAKTSDRVYFPFKALDEDGNDNYYQTSKISSEGYLYIVIDPTQTVQDIYK